MQEALNIAGKAYRALEKKQPRTVRFIGNDYSVNPDGGISSSAACEIPAMHKILILHYLLSESGKTETGELIDFKQLPGGITYNPVFEGRVYGRLTGVFGEDHELFRLCGEKIGGVKADLGDAAMKFEALPGVPVYIILFAGDEEFRPGCKILFDSGIKGYFPTEDAIIICEELSRTLTKEAETCQKQ